MSTGAEGRVLTSWRHGDIGRIQRCVPGGDPYWITVVWRHGGGWYNAAGTLRPLDPQPVDDEIELLIRDHEPLNAPARLPSPQSPSSAPKPEESTDV